MSYPEYDPKGLIDAAASREIIKGLVPSPGIDDITTLLHLAAGYQYGGQDSLAARYYRKVLLLDPANPDALHLLGVCMHSEGNNEHAIPLIERSIAIAQDSQKWNNLGIVQSSMGNIPAAVMAYRKSIQGDPTWIAAYANLIFALDLHPLSTPELLLAERRSFDTWYCRALTKMAPPHTNSRDPNRKLKVGYVSGDFRTHSASKSFLPFIQAHDPRKVEVYLYSNNAKSPEEQPDAVTDAFVKSAQVWSQITGVPDDQLAAMIRADQIDVLVDLSGYSAQGRLQLFARKPAPIQVTGWGYATGTGLDAMDYLVADELTVPPESERYYHEKILRLPSLLCYTFSSATPEIGPVPFTKAGQFTFGSIGRALKINDQVLVAWAEILRRVPDSVLLLKGDEYRHPEFRKKIMDLMVALGVDERRVKILTATSSFDHLATYNRIDLALDTWPVGSGITALDAVTMGVPMVTMLGDLIPSRVAASILSRVGLTRQNRTIQEYVEQAVALSDDIATLEECRRELRGRLERSIIMDGASYCRAWEKILREIWRAYCKGDDLSQKAAA